MCTVAAAMYNQQNGNVHRDHKLVVFIQELKLPFCSSDEVFSLKFGISHKFMLSAKSEHLFTYYTVHYLGTCLLSLCIIRA